MKITPSVVIEVEVVNSIIWYKQFVEVVVGVVARTRKVTYCRSVNCWKWLKVLAVDVIGRWFG